MSPRKTASPRSVAHSTTTSQPPLSPRLRSLTSAFTPSSSAFDRAAIVVNISNNSSSSHTTNSNSNINGTDSDIVVFSAEDQLLLYGAYKQATKGNIKGIKPTFFDIPARSKWQAWANMRGKTTDQAKEEYVDLVVKALRKPGSHPDLLTLADEILSQKQVPGQHQQQPPFLDKDLPPISLHPHESSSTTSVYYPTRKSSISHSVRSTATGVRSAATSVYELASESLVDNDSDSQHHQPATVHTILPGNNSSETQEDASPRYHEVTETVIEEEVLNDDEYLAEIKSQSPIASPASPASPAVPTKPIEHDDDNEEDEEDEEDEVYQSSEEYDEDGSESDVSSVQMSPRISLDSTPASKATSNSDFVDEGVFEEDEKEQEPPKSPQSASPRSSIAYNNDTHNALGARSRGGSVSSGYGGSIMSDKEGPAPAPLSLNGFIAGSIKDQGLNGPLSPPVLPYHVNPVYDILSSSPSLSPSLEMHSDTSAVLETTELTKATLECEPTASTAQEHASTEGLICPVSKKSAASGGVCPAAMFAQARAATATATEVSNGFALPTTEKTQDAVKTVSTIQSSPATFDSDDISAHEAPPRSNAADHHRSYTEPISSEPTESAPSSVSSSATWQGRRLGQGIVSRFSAFRSSLAAASARAASSALSGGSASNTKSNTATTSTSIRDPNTQQELTIVCPHQAQTQILETEVVRLQTDISVLHERLDLLQESLKIKSQTREQERRSARGILKMVLRQGLINAVLLLLVFAVLYKRRSPIAFAIIAYVGHGAKEGEAGWKAFVRWMADMVRRGQRNQQLMLNAGRRNGYW